MNLSVPGKRAGDGPPRSSVVQIDANTGKVVEIDKQR